MADILVTGGTGFIGRALTTKLESQGHRVTALSSREGDIADPELFRKFPKPTFERLFHLAGRTYVPDSWEQPQTFLNTNVVGTANALQFCAAHKIPVTLVSGYLYGRPEALPIAETCPPYPTNPYALSKHLAETVGEFFHRSHGLGVTVIRPFNIYGPGQNPKFLIPTIVGQVLTAEKIVVEDLAPKRDYLFLDDLIDALIITIRCKKGFNVYNMGSGQSFSVGEVIEIIQSVAGTRKAVVSRNHPRLNEVPDVVADISKARQELNWRPRVSFEQGIRELLK